MERDSTIIGLEQPGTILDPLTEIAREGARRMLAQALKEEVDDFLAGRSQAISRRANPYRAARQRAGAEDSDGYRSHYGRSAKGTRSFFCVR